MGLDGRRVSEATGALASEGACRVDNRQVGKRGRGEGRGSGRPGVPLSQGSAGLSRWGWGGDRRAGQEVAGGLQIFPQRGHLKASLRHLLQLRVCVGVCVRV